MKKSKHIHGICIFLKTSELWLNYCDRELMEHLHKNASHSMALCSTSAKCSNFLVGYMLKPLRALLDKQRIKGV